jgi:hypothetical protein
LIGAINELKHAFTYCAGKLPNAGGVMARPGGAIRAGKFGVLHELKADAPPIS